MFVSCRLMKQVVPLLASTKALAPTGERFDDPPSKPKRGLRRHMEQQFFLSTSWNSKEVWKCSHLQAAGSSLSLNKPRPTLILGAQNPGPWAHCTVLHHPGSLTHFRFLEQLHGHSTAHGAQKLQTGPWLTILTSELPNPFPTSPPAGPTLLFLSKAGVLIQT